MLEKLSTFLDFLESHSDIKKYTKIYWLDYLISKLLVLSSYLTVGMLVLSIFSLLCTFVIGIISLCGVGLTEFGYNYTYWFIGLSIPSLVLVVDRIVVYILDDYKLKKNKY